MFEHLAELFPQATFHGVFGWVYAVFRQTAGLDIAIEKHDPGSLVGKLACSKQSGRASAYYGNEMLNGQTILLVRE
jgi:hypothetical protein